MDTFKKSMEIRYLAPVSTNESKEKKNKKNKKKTTKGLKTMN